MSAFRNSAAWPALLLAAVLAAGAAGAQTGPERVGAPIPLRPGFGAAPPPAQPAGPEPAAPSAPGFQVERESGVPSGVSVESTLPGRRPAARRGGEIRIEALRAPEPAAVGTLDDGNGGLGADMWAGSRLETLKLLLPRLPMLAASPAMQSLSARLLLTAARLPEADSEPPSLLALRLERLAAGGRLEALNDLLRQAPPGDEPALTAARVDALWLGGDSAAACPLVLGQVARSGAPRWLKAAAFCHALRREPARAQVYEQLLYETAHQDHAFFAMLAALTGRGGEPPAALPEATPLHLAMLRALDWQPPAEALVQAPPMLLRGDAGGGLPPALALEAAERAAALGALDLAALAERYAAAAFTPQQLRAAPEDVPDGALGNALLSQAAAAAETPERKARLYGLALARAREAGRHAALAGVLAEPLANLPPASELLWFAAEAGRTLLAAGRVEPALGWWRLANADETAAGAAAARALWPGMLIAAEAERVPFDAARFENWWRASSEAPLERRARDAALLLTLLEALGQAVAPAAWDRVYAAADPTATSAASAAYLQALGRAAEAGRRGETVLLALINLGPAGPASADPLLLGAVVAALGRVGLEEPARQIALEAVLARDF